MRPPVVLVHGIVDDGACFDVVRAWLGARGFVTSAPDLVPADGSAGLGVLAEQLLAHIQAVGARVDLVGFSLGGLVARYMLQRLDGVRHVRRLVTIASPHQGSYSAYLLRSLPGAELRPGSTFLEDLAADWPATARAVPTTAIWTPFDLIVCPGGRARLAGAANVRVLALRHTRLLSAPRTWEAVERALAAPDGSSEALDAQRPSSENERNLNSP